MSLKYNSSMGFSMEEETQKISRSFGKQVRNQHFPIKDPRFLGRAAAATSMSRCAETGNSFPCDTGLTVLLSELQEKLSAQAGYRRLLEEADSFSHDHEKPWQHQPLIETPDLRIGLLTVFRFSSIPLHDHPGACGLLKVLSGKIRVGHYDLESSSENSQRVVWLNRKTVREYAVGESACYHRHSENVHQVTSLDSKSILLNMVVRPYDETKRSWYFPVTGFLPKERDLYVRVTKWPKAKTPHPPEPSDRQQGTRERKNER